MFKEVKTTIATAEGLSSAINRIKEGLVEFYDIPPFKVINRLNRQLMKLGKVQTELDDAQKTVLTELLTEEGLEKAVKAAEKKNLKKKDPNDRGAKINDILNEEQQKSFFETMEKERQSEMTIGFLSEDFSELLEDAELPISLIDDLSLVIEHFDTTVWNPVVEEVAVEEA